MILPYLYMYEIWVDEEGILFEQPFPSQYYNTSQWYEEIVEHVISGGVVIDIKK